MAADPSVLEAIELAGRRIPATLRALKAYRHVSDQAIADACDMKRSAVQARMRGHTLCSSRDLAAFAAFFGVSVEAFFKPTPWVGASSGADTDVLSRIGLAERGSPDLGRGNHACVMADRAAA